MESLLTSLRSVRLTGGVFIDAEFTAPWSVIGSVSPEQCRPFGVNPIHVIAYHYVLEGSLVIQTPGSPAVTVDAGEIVMVPSNDEHQMGSAVDIPPVSSRSVVRPPVGGGLARILHGGGGDKTRLFCGFLGSDAPDSPILSMLPKILKLRVDDGAVAEWVASSFRFAHEMSADQEHSAMVLGKVAELLFVEAVRRYVETLPVAQNGWLAGLQDPVVAQALSLLHGSIAYPWTTEDLAARVGFSRSAFALRFKELVGDPPMRYLTKWRMQFAAQRLQESNEGIAAIAFDTGYDSESAFNRAFKREFALPPAAWREQHQPV